MASCCPSPTDGNVKISFRFCSAMWKCANGSAWPFLQPIQKILRIPMKDLNSKFPLRSRENFDSLFFRLNVTISSRS